MYRTHSFNAYLLRVKEDYSVIIADDFSAQNDAEMIQQAIDFAAVNNTKSVQLLDRDYSITQPIVIKEGVRLCFGYGARFIISGNFRVIELERNASLIGAYIAIADSAFNSAVIYLDGKNKFYNSWFRTKVKDVTIVNWSGTHKGTGIKLYSNGPGHEISFVTFQNIKLVSLGTALLLQAVTPQSGISYVNGNTFSEFVIDDCVHCIRLLAGVTYPNDCSGNVFNNLQIQTSSSTVRVLSVTGQYNEFHGIAWDITTITHNQPIVILTNNSSYNTVALKTIPLNKIQNNGVGNKIEIT
ncbi:hypothetical protein [Guptibacillus algicola]|uniref:hypothetical protein n=1 Tax=Guptibacillus algicola TaxID=225844 RepID=UPI001CD41635|nr:hypothetical protein [Alkalihalobacillus algicola]MCA0987041.1 hypothetical protein [Alkalihalobacillus algicola]